MAMADTSDQRSAGPSPSRVTGAASRAMVQLLADRGVPANEVVVTEAQRKGSGEGAAWEVKALRGREVARHEFSLELVDKVLARGPCDEWYGEVRKLLEGLGLAFPN